MKTDFPRPASAYGSGAGPNVCAAIPAYNSESTVARVVMGARAHVSCVLVIDDGSTDGTGAQAKRAGAEVIRLGKNHGKGRALKTAFAYALKGGYDALVTLDADLQHEPEELPRFIACHATRGSNLVIGDRLHQAELIPRLRYVPNRVGAFCFSRLTGRRILDAQSGFRLYDREIMERIPIRYDGFEAESDVLLRAGAEGCRIDFVPIRAIYFQGPLHQSHFRPFRDTTRICLVFLRNLLRKTSGLC